MLNFNTPFSDSYDGAFPYFSTNISHHVTIDYFLLNIPPIFTLDSQAPNFFRAPPLILSAVYCGSSNLIFSSIEQTCL